MRKALLCAVILTALGLRPLLGLTNRQAALDNHLPCLTWKPQSQKLLAPSSLRASGTLPECTRTPSFPCAGFHQKRELRVSSRFESALARIKKATLWSPVAEMGCTQRGPQIQKHGLQPPRRTTDLHSWRSPPADQYTQDAGPGDPVLGSCPEGACKVKLLTTVGTDHPHTH